MPNENASYRDIVAKFENLKRKLAVFGLEKNFFHALETRPTIKFHQILSGFKFLFCYQVVFTKFLKSGGTFHHLATLLNISMPDDQKFCICSPNAKYIYATIPPSAVLVTHNSIR